MRDLNREFGNLGLAAAAYNAGSGRVYDWLAGRKPLPGETVAYVRLVTGRSAEEWAGRPKTAEASGAVRVPCTQAGLTIPDAAGAVPLPRRPVPAWGAEVAGGPTQAKALARYREVQVKYSAILGGREPHFVIRVSDTGAVRARAALAPVGHRQPHRADALRDEAVSAWERQQQQVNRDLDRKLIICRGC